MAQNTSFTTPDFNTTTGNETSTTFSTKPTTTKTTVTTTTPTTTTTASTRTTLPSTTTVSDGGAVNGSLIGGVAGGVAGAVIIVVIVIVVICYRRRKSNKKPRVVKPPPDKEYLERAQASNQYVPDPTRHIPCGHQITDQLSQSATDQSPYVNITFDGETNESTDPSVGPDGYLKKTSHFPFLKLNKKKSKKRNVQTEVASTESPIYGNEPTVPGQLSTPTDQDPPTSRASASYVTAKVGQSQESKHKKRKAKTSRDYINLQDQKKGESVLGVSAIQKENGKKMKKKRKTGEKYQDQRKEPNSDATDITGMEQYYNTRVGTEANPGSLETYENVGAESVETVAADELYEVP